MPVPSFRLLPMPATNWLSLGVPMTHSLGSINLLEHFTECRISHLIYLPIYYKSTHLLQIDNTNLKGCKWAVRRSFAGEVWMVLSTGASFTWIWDVPPSRQVDVFLWTWKLPELWISIEASCRHKWLHHWHWWSTQPQIHSYSCR
jgi:hypothetical protein